MGKVEFFLPDFLIIGANKAGTTSIVNYMRLHPSIHISPVKEPMFFTSDPARSSATLRDASLGRPYFTVTLDEYSSLFKNHKPTAKIFGEASTSYLANPVISAKLIKKIVPNVKIIAILRDPAERAISAYKMCYGYGLEKRPFYEIVKEAPKQTTILPMHGVREYIRNGLYFQLLKPYYDFFDEGQILILRYDDLVEDSQAFMSYLFDFLKVNAEQVNTKRRFNTATDNLKQHVEIRREDIDKLRELFVPELRNLQTLTSINIGEWLAH